jgi:hypothetical protein
MFGTSFGTKMEGLSPRSHPALSKIERIEIVSLRSPPDTVYEPHAHPALRRGLLDPSCHFLHEIRPPALVDWLAQRAQQGHLFGAKAERHASVSGQRVIRRGRYPRFA